MNNVFELKPKLVSEVSANCSLKTEEWLTTKEAAAYLKVTPKSFYNKVSNGLILYYKFGRLNRYLKADLDKYLLGNRRGGSYGN